MIKQIIIFFTGISFVAFTEETPHSQRQIALLLDSYEQLTSSIYDTYNFGAVSNALLSALEQKVPIITTKAIFNNFLFARKVFDDFATLPVPQLLTIYGERPNDDLPTITEIKNNIIKIHDAIICSNQIIMSSTSSDLNYISKQINENCEKDILTEGKLYEITKNFTLAKLTYYNPNEWINKKIDNLTYLLIPRNYYEQELPELLQYQQKIVLSSLEPLTQLELKLGIPIDHMSDISQSELITPQKAKIAWKRFFDLDQIFIQKKSYALSFLKINPPQWTLYIMGHGSAPTDEAKNTIAGLHEDTIDSWLNFLKNKILTKLVVFSSCYLGGSVSARHVSQFQGPINETTYPYTLIFIGLANAPVFSSHIFLALPPYITSDYIDIKNKKLLFKSKGFSIHNFFQDTKIDISDYSSLLQNIIGTPTPNNIALIKPANLEWTLPLDALKKSVTIYTTLAETRTKDLDLYSLLHKDTSPYPTTVLFRAINIPFGINITYPFTNLNFISAVPGHAHHTLAKINATDRPLGEILSAFFQVEKMSTQKTFFIKEIISLDYPQGIFDTYIFVNIPYKGHLQNVVYTTINNEFFVCAVPANKSFLSNFELTKINMPYQNEVKQWIFEDEHWNIKEHAKKIREAAIALKEKPQQLPEKAISSHRIYETNQILNELATSLGFLAMIFKAMV